MTRKAKVICSKTERGERAWVPDISQIRSTPTSAFFAIPTSGEPTSGFLAM